MTPPVLTFRHALKKDVPLIVQMLADDALGEKREQVDSPLPESYFTSFKAIAADPNNELIVACRDPQIIGVLQITFIPYLTYQGGWRAMIEGVRVASKFRSQGIGRKMLQWAIQRARERSCHLVQLTTDKARTESIKFYKRLGFIPSHEGMKLHLSD